MKINFKNAPGRVVVIGGGACGMTAAWELARHGADVTVLEREPAVGGLCATVERDGWRFDLGGHRFISRSGDLVDRVVELLGEGLLTRERRSIILHGGRRYSYPLSAENLFRNLEVTEAARALASYAAARLRPRPDVTFEDWVVSRFGRHLYDRFFGPYTEKLWGIPPSTLSADWASERISLLDLGDAALRLAGLRRSRRPRSYARRYYYPRLGIGHIFAAMETEIRRLGGSVRLGTEVTGLTRDRRGAVREVRLADGTSLPCDFVISTASLPFVARLLSPGDGAVDRHAAALRTRGVRFLNILLDRPDVSENTWMYVSEARHLMTRIQEPKRRSPDMAPPGKTSLMLEIPCDPGSDVWRAPDGELFERCARDLDELGVKGVRGDCLGVFSTFIEQGYPVYSLGYDDHRRALLGVAAGAPNLLSCGRQGTFRYIFMDIAMEMGLAAARQILDGAPRPAELAGFRSDRQLIESQATTA
jgi:protoporphyrinogen oxidase